MPSLPQTKYCSLCPAKFTRTTHLNRHLRSHTNERSHRCNVCHAEFTRSDLLTRHKRTCGDSNMNKSRRKSCQACAESKVKCNLQYPCSKCSSRGRECIFINDPETSRNKRLASQKPLLYTAIAEPPVDAHSTIFQSSSASLPYSTLYPLGADSSSPTLSFNPSLSTTQLDTTSSGLGLLECSQSSSSSSCSSSPSDLFETPVSIASAFDLDFQALELDPQLQFFSKDGFDAPLIDDSISSCLPELGIHRDYERWIEGKDTRAPFGNEDHLSPVYSFPLEKSGGMVHDLSALELPISSDSVSGHHFTTSMPIVPYDSSAILYGDEVPTEDLTQYLYMFFSAFSAQIPIIHRPTWRMEGKPAILIRAMQACGALFVKGFSALDFVNQTLVDSQEALILEFSKPCCSLKDQVFLILAAVLLQSIGLLRPQSHQNSSTKMYHGILVLMIRRTGLIRLLSSWTPPDLTSSYNLDGSWADWARYETLKRAIFLAYVQDCSNCINFSSTPSFLPSEFELNLPCDDTLWNAGSVNEWLQALQTPSPYGTGQIRLSGVPAQAAFVTLNKVGSSVPSPPLNPFSHFILIYTVLRDIFLYPSQDPFIGDSYITPTTLSSQYQLYNWLRLWVGGPEVNQFEKNGLETPFVCDVLPLYWLAHFSLLGMQDSTLQTGPLEGEAGNRYDLLKGWLDHIKMCLRNGSQVLPSQLWPEVGPPPDQAPFTRSTFSSSHIPRSFVD